jgi:hypothetical protein
MSYTSATVTSAAVGMTLEAVLAWAAAERVLMDAADRKPPFPGALTVGSGASRKHQQER